jgi:hypothetical protein
MIAQYVYYIELRPSAVDLQVGVGSTDTYVSECTVACSAEYSRDGGVMDEGAAGERVRTVARSKRWQIRVSSVQPQCLVVRCRVLAGSVLVSNVECAWVPASHFGTLHKTLLHAPGTVAVEVGVGVRVQLQEATYDTDALRELHACHNLRSLPGLLPDEVSVARYLEQVRHSPLNMNTAVQPGHLGAVLNTLNAPPLGIARDTTEEDALSSTECDRNVAERAANIERDVRI